MISVSLTHDGDGRLVPTYTQRRPDETLHDYLVRSRSEMTVHIRMLEATCDAQTKLFGSERGRLRRAMILLALWEAGFAAAAYILLARYGLAGSASVPFLATMIGTCALAGAVAPLGIASMLGRVPSWSLAAENLARRLLRRPLQVVEPSATILPLAKASDGPVDTSAIEPGREVDRDPEIEAVIEDCAVSDLEMWTTFWGIGLIVFQAAVMTIGLSTMRAAFGVPLDIVLNDVPLVLLVCLVGGLFLLVFADLASNGLVRMALWWRRR